MLVFFLAQGFKNGCCPSRSHSNLKIYVFVIFCGCASIFQDDISIHEHVSCYETYNTVCILKPSTQKQECNIKRATSEVKVTLHSHFYWSWGVISIYTKMVFDVEILHTATYLLFPNNYLYNFRQTNDNYLFTLQKLLSMSIIPDRLIKHVRHSERRYASKIQQPLYLLAKKPLRPDRSMGNKQTKTMAAVPYTVLCNSSR